MSEVLFLPVKPKWADVIMSGKKTLELRKREPKHELPMMAIVYASSPRCEIVGAVEWYGTVCQGVVAFSDHDLGRACVSREQLRKYYSKKTWAYGLCLRNSVTFTKPIPLETMRTAWLISPPQQWRYIGWETYSDIVRFGQ
jgi:predicted transcriptional regulator